LQYNVEWDPQKAKSNRVKHKVSFDLAATAFKDPRAISIYDESHSGDEERWITMGLSFTGVLLIVHHTFEQIDEEVVTIRIISSRKTTKKEQQQYGE
jgi:hypothetical protein